MKKLKILTSTLFVCVSANASAATTPIPTASEIFLKFHQSLYQHCRDEKIECTAFPSQEPQQLKADPTYWLQNIKVQNYAAAAKDQAIARKETQALQSIQAKVVKEVPEIVQAYQVLGTDDAQSGPKNHDEAVKWVIANAAQLSEGLQKSKAYSDQNAYAYAKLNLVMKFVYRALHEGNFQQSDLDAKYAFEKAAYQISEKLGPKL